MTIRPLTQQTPSTTTGVVQRIVEATVDRTLAGTDRVTGALAGAASGAAGYLSKMPGAAVDGMHSFGNLLHAKKIGPNIKAIACLASPLIAGVALAGAGLGLAVATLAGVGIGFTAHDSEKPREFTIDKAAGSAWNKTRSVVAEAGDEAVKGSREIRDIEVKPGDDLWDIPLPPFVRTGRTLAATVAGLAMGSLGGLATALTITCQTAWGGIKKAATDFSAANVAAGLGSVVGAPVTGALHGLSKVATTPIVAAGKAWKENSLGAALKAGREECFDTKPGRAAVAAGALVGGAAVAVPTAAATAVATTAVEMARGLKMAATDSSLSLGGKALSVPGTLLSAPVAGVLHGAATGVGTPFASAAHAWQKESVADGVAEGVRASHQGTAAVTHAAGALLGNVPTAVAAAAAVTAGAGVREVVGGVVEAVRDEKLNVRGKLLAAVGGVPGDAVSAVVQGLGTLVGVPGVAASTAFAEDKTAAGAREAARFAARSLQAAVHPGVLVETAPPQP